MQRWRARQPATPRRSKLDPYREAVLDLVAATPDMTISEMQARLAAEHGVAASRATLWMFLERYGLSFKKSRRMRQSKTGLIW